MIQIPKRKIEHAIDVAKKLANSVSPGSGDVKVTKPGQPVPIHHVPVPGFARGGAAVRIAKAEGGAFDGAGSAPSMTPGALTPGGLSFPAEEAASRLAAKHRREASAASGKKADAGMPKNPRTVIRAPRAQPGERQLPDFVAGNISHDDWVKRHEQILSPEEVHHSAKWYENIYANFRQRFPNPAEAKRQMRAWLVAQQNVSPAGAMNNVLMQHEQMKRGVPEHLWEAGGMPMPTKAARAVLQGRDITQGVGQKIADFVDSAEGKDVRSWMGNHPAGGKPFVVDVHTARDTGMVDDELINHLRRLGYHEGDLKKLVPDLKGTPTEAAYENRGNWGRSLTDHLNKKGWMGRRDWTPAEAQAVGWMGMTKLTRNAEEDSESGLNRNLRRISYELDPGEGAPWGNRYGPGLAALPDHERRHITADMANRAMGLATQLSGIHPPHMVHGTGAWENYQNPAAVGQALATHKGADITANAIGHMLQQTEVWHNRVKPMTANPKGFAIDFTERGSKNLADKEHLRNFWEGIMQHDPSGLIRGYQPITHPTGEVGVRALIDKGGAATHKKLVDALSENGALHKMLSALPYDTSSEINEAEISKARNDWKESPNGEAYISRLKHLLGHDPSEHLGAARSQLEEALEAHLTAAHKRQGGSWAPPASAPTRKIVKADGGAVDYALGIIRSHKK